MGEQFAVSTHAHGEPGPAGTGHRLPDWPHGGPGQVELVGVEDRFVTELQRAQARFAERLCASRTGSHHARGPTVFLAELKPGRYRLLPGPRIAHRIATGKTHADLDAIGDCGAAIGGEDHRLVPAGREVPEGIVLAVRRQQAAYRRLVLAGQGVLRALRLEHHHGGRHQGQGAEQAHQRVEKHVRLAGEQFRARGGESADAVDRVGKSLARLQRAGEHFQQPPRDQDTQHVASHQYRCGFEQRTPADPGPELVIGQYERSQCGDVERQAEELADVLESASVAFDQGRDVEPDPENHNNDQHPPGDAFAGHQCTGQDRHGEGPGEARIGEVEEVVVDEFPRHLGQVPDERRDARQQ